MWRMICVVYVYLTRGKRAPEILSSGGKLMEESDVIKTRWQVMIEVRCSLQEEMRYF